MMAITIEDQDICETLPDDAKLMGWESITVVGVGLHSRSVESLRRMIREIAVDSIIRDLNGGEVLVGFGLDAPRDAIVYYFARSGGR